MIDLKNFGILLDQIAEEKGLSREQILDTIEQAIAAAYKKDYGKKGQVIKAKLDLATGNTDFWQLKQVVTEDMLYTEEELEAMKERNEREEELPQEGEERKIRFNPERHILLEEAQKIQPGIQVGEDLEQQVEQKLDYGRIAAQTAKQVILQKLREAERNTAFEEMRGKEGELVSGVVQRVEGRVVFIDLGKTIGVLPKEEQVPGEFYRIGQRLRFFVLQVSDTPKGPNVLLSRAYPKFISKLFALEVPEIASETVEIKAIAREPGSRTKVAVASNQAEVDPVGAMVGQRGTRVSAVINELGGEKIDIIAWAEDPEVFVANSLSPAKVLQANEVEKGRMVAIVPEDQLSLAIGRDGQNVRLAAKLTGWKIDIRTPEGTEVQMEEAEAGEALAEEPVEAAATQEANEEQSS